MFSRRSIRQANHAPLRKPLTKIAKPARGSTSETATSARNTTAHKCNGGATAKPHRAKRTAAAILRPVYLPRSFERTLTLAIPLTHFTVRLSPWMQRLPRLPGSSFRQTASVRELLIENS